MTPLVRGARRGQEGDAAGRVVLSWAEVHSQAERLGVPAHAQLALLWLRCLQHAWRHQLFTSQCLSLRREYQNHSAVTADQRERSHVLGDDALIQRPRHVKLSPWGKRASWLRKQPAPIGWYLKFIVIIATLADTAPTSLLDRAASAINKETSMAAFGAWRVDDVGHVACRRL